MKIYFAGDHAGFELKGKLIEFVRSLGHKVEDLGPFSYDTNDDYPDYVIPLARKIAETSPVSLRETPSSRREFTNSPLPARRSAGGEGSTPTESRRRNVFGIIIGGSGQGEAMCANRVRGARAALLVPGPQMVPLIKASRDHNDSNIFAIGARFCTLDEAKKGITVWLETPFSGDERHIRRLGKIEQITNNL